LTTLFSASKLRTQAETIRIELMKMWQIFAVGVAAVLAMLFLPLYEPVLAAAGALVVVAVVVLGFFMRPLTDVFYVRTTVFIFDVDHHVYDFSLEHDYIAVRVELARLWLLFLPTFLALGFLVVTAAQGTTWNISLLQKDVFVALLLCRGLFFVVVVVPLSMWISERRALRDADACSARGVFVKGGTATYTFVDRSGGYYSGAGLFLRSVRQPELATLVLYNVRNPQLNKIGMTCLFHRLVIIGRGVTEFDEATITRAVSLVEPSCKKQRTQSFSAPSSCIYTIVSPGLPFMLLLSRDRGISFWSLNQRGSRGRRLRVERSGGAESAARRRACG
jgi:hypothetical protein